MKYEPITDVIIGAAIEVHRALGPGLLESTYRRCLCRELQLRGVQFICELPVPVEYKGEKLDCGYRIDVLVADLIVVELKSVDFLAPIHEAQLLTYLGLSKKTIGLLINFNVPVLKDGIKRRVLNLKE
jgi:GxxExxY protein